MMFPETGSHIILETSKPSHQRIAIPNQKAPRIGTLHSILRAVSVHQGITREDMAAGL